MILGIFLLFLVFLIQTVSSYSLVISLLYRILEIKEDYQIVEDIHMEGYQ
jgi:hypothetical protein